MAVPEASEAKSIKLSHLTYFQIWFDFISN
jgi:hypothetical protein